MFDGVTGVVMKPISGAKEDGVEGFFKGVGKGMVGLVTRPTAGVIDFASGTFGAVKRYGIFGFASGTSHKAVLSLHLQVKNLSVSLKFWTR